MGRTKIDWLTHVQRVKCVTKIHEYVSDILFDNVNNLIAKRCSSSYRVIYQGQ